MSRREVKCVRQDRDGDITAIGNQSKLWSPVSKDQAIRHIEWNLHSYYVNYNGNIVEVKVVREGQNKYLRTDPDNTLRNNLDELHDC